MSESNRWLRLERLFDEAVVLPLPDRDAFVQEHVAGDAELASQLKRMLDAHERAGPLDRLAVPLASSDLRARLGRALHERYHLEDELGSGGMATVFLAFEHKHGRRVVIKVLQPGMAAIIGPARFEDEVQIAARLSHPHILALLDSGEAGGLRYYVMPYLDGETLRTRLARDGSLVVSTAITLLRDIADALAHAHRAGVVHRDLKPENVLCAGDHAYLLDFGIAKVRPDPLTLATTNPGMAVGTPGYMAPEQAAGRPVDGRADLYVWGLLAREILTGSRESDARLAERADVPRTLVALVDATLAIDPAERPANARMLVTALDSMLAPVVRVRPRWAGGAVAVAVVVAVLLFWRDPGQPTSMAPGSLAEPIAVAPLRDETGDTTLAGLGRLAGDWITQGLHETGVQVVAWPAVRAALEQNPADAGAALRSATGARTVVQGRIYRIGDSLRFQVEVVDAEKQLVLAAPAPVVVTGDSAAQGVRMLRDRVMGALAVQRDDRLTPGGVFATRPPTYEAYRVFDLALTDFDAYRYREAGAGMVAAWRMDTTFLAALVYAAYAASNTGNQALTDSLVRGLTRRRAGLSEFHAAMTDHLVADLSGDGPAALAAASRAARLAPGSRAGYNAALTLLSLNRPREALDWLESLDPDTGPMRGWPAYWSQRSYARHLLGDHAGERRDALEMRRRHAGQRVSWVIEARALAAKGDLAALDSLLGAAEGLDPDVYWSQGAMRVVAGEELAAHEQTGASLPILVAAEQWLRRRLEVEPGHDAHRYWLVSSLMGQRRWRAAEPIARQLAREQPDRLLYQALVASLAARRGDSNAAASLTGASPRDQGEAMVYQARVAAVLHQDQVAIRLLGEATRRGVSGWHWVHGSAGIDFEGMAGDVRYQQVMKARVPDGK